MGGIPSGWDPSGRISSITPGPVLHQSCLKAEPVNRANLSFTIAPAENHFRVIDLDRNDIEAGSVAQWEGHLPGTSLALMLSSAPKQINSRSGQDSSFAVVLGTKPS